ncbi:MAG TPA: phage tail tape measure protein [Lachnospiraceae bacterium]|nr:phage tail tape measure protein [Lachnospiraceae bacterium]
MASNGRIKGITLTIGGDTQGLEKALSNVNKNINTTQSALKDVERLLKIDPANTELLAQKQRLLTVAIGETKEKLWAMKEASEQASQALARGEITQNQYDALQREIIATENTLKELEKQANTSENALGELGEQAGISEDALKKLNEKVDDSAQSFERLSQTGENLKNVGATIESVGQQIMPVSKTVANLGVEAVKAAADFDSAMSKVSAISGASAEDLEKLSNKAREMGKKTKFSASEAAEAMNYMAMAGWKTGHMLDGIDGVMNLAAASGEDLATTSDILTDAMTAFGIKVNESTNGVKNAIHVSDVMAAAMANANTDVSLMGEGFKYCSSVAGALGFSLEDTTEAIGLMSNASVKGSMSGTAMRKVMLALAEDVELSGKEIGNLTIKTKDSNGKMKDLGQILKECRFAFSKMSESEQAANAEALVGKNAVSGFLAAMNAAPEDINKLRGAIENCDGAAENMATIMQDNLNGQITTLKSKLSELAIAFGNILMPAIRKVTEIVGNLIDWFNGLSPKMKTIIVVIGVIVAALGPALVIIGKIVWSIGQVMTIIPGIVTALKGVKTAITVVTTAVKAFSAALIANPIALIIAGITALVAAFVYFWNTSEEFRQFWIDLWEGIKETAKAVWEGIKDFFVSAWEGIKSAAQSIWNGIKDFFASIWNGIKSLAQSIWNGIKDFFASIWNGIKTTAQSIWNGIKGFFVSIWNGIKSTAQSIWNGVKDFFKSTWEDIKSTAQNVWGKVEGFLTSTWQSLKTKTESTWNTIKESSTSVWGSIKTSIGSIVQRMGSSISEHIGNLKNKISEIWNGVRQSTTATWNNLVAGVRAALGNLAPNVREGFQEAIEFITSLPSKAIQWGRDFVVGLINGIKQKINAVLEPVREIANKIRGFLHFSRPDEGPLRDYETWMPDFMKGLAQGIKNNQRLVTDAVNELSKNMSIHGNVSLIGQANEQNDSGNGMSEMLAVIKQYLPYLAESKDIVLDTGETIGAFGPKLNREFQRIDMREKGR